MPDDRPNVLLITTDHWPGSLLGCMGHPTVQTPTLDMLAGNGVIFPNAYSECPVCVPARRTLMTGLKPHSHGMFQNSAMPMPEAPTIAQTFRDNGYQAYGVGKLHVQPQRRRLGFDDVLLDEEGRGGQGCRQDDYELFLGDHGYPGERFGSGMCNNMYMHRAWHLPERLHVTNWGARQMARQIIRRDPLRPAFWYLGFSQPHPPMMPLQAYLDLYRAYEPAEPFVGDWARGEGVSMPIQRELQRMRNAGHTFSPEQIREIRRAFYASATHIDHQLRIVIGTLRQEGLLGNTIICFTSDHGDMLGNHGLWAKHWFYEDSARVPMILAGTNKQQDDPTVGHHRRDDRLVGLADVMPTLLHLAGLEIPAGCEGIPMVGPDRHEYLYGAFSDQSEAESCSATRMIRDQRYKLIYYPVGNVVQLFDMQEDPRELHDLAGRADVAEAQHRLTRLLIEQFSTSTETGWLTGGELNGLPEAGPAGPEPSRWFGGQRGIHWPNP
jgi:arylsulfatase A-like enzyme